MASKIREKERKTSHLPSIEELRRAIPPHCFEKNTFHSFAYLFLDYVMLTAMYLTVSYFESVGGWLGLLTWYWLTGMVYTAFFMIGHDASHGSFSDSAFWCCIGGHLAMAPILTPFWPMGKSHRQHHNFTAHLQKDKGYFWTTEEEYHDQGFLAKHWAKLPISNFIKWNPLHVLFGVPDGSLYWPYSKVFRTNFERLQCVFSGSTCFICVFIALNLNGYSVYGFLKYYYIPILFHGFWMVMLTTLQHQDDETEVYEQGTWTFVMGQTQTFDRVYGLGIDWVLHHVTDCHVVHHFFPKIPHYHLKEATEAITRVMKWYPGVYKRRACYFHLFEFLRLNFALEYLVEKSTGVRKFNASNDFRH
ncbi:FAT-2 protein [Aphelenchoides avenae]|nr:FAT-2 protein [Aphelenchus avenae]